MEKNTNKVFIIAEAGVNHNGSLELAMKLIDSAKQAGADAVKFQTFKTENNISKFAPKAKYQIDTTDSAESQYEMAKKLELSPVDFAKLQKHCEIKGITFLSTPFELDSIELLHNMGLEIFKIPSGEITNLPYLRKVGSLNKKIIMSTGMADLEEIEAAIKILEDSGTQHENITVLHCNTEYPTPMKDVNLSAMLSIKKQFNVDVGYSDHTLGIEIPIAAVALGAKVIEKHFTLDKNMVGPDHRASLEPAELRAMVDAIRNIEQALGDGVKKPSVSELKNKPIVRKSIVAAKKINAGDVLTAENLSIKRPGTGVSPMLWDEVMGKKVLKDFEMDEVIEMQFLEA